DLLLHVGEEVEGLLAIEAEEHGEVDLAAGGAPAIEEVEHRVAALAERAGGGGEGAGVDGEAGVAAGGPDAVLADGEDEGLVERGVGEGAQPLFEAIEGDAADVLAAGAQAGGGDRLAHLAEVE